MKKKRTFILWILGVWQILGLLMPVEAKAADLKPTEALIQSTPYLSSAERDRLITSLQEAHNKGLPGPEAQIIISKSLTREVAPEVINGFLELTIEAYQQQLPVEPILNKMKEGLAKGIEGEGIQRAATGVIKQLRVSKEMVEQAAQRGIKINGLQEKQRFIGAMALAQARGMEPGSLQQIIQTSLSHKDPGLLAVSQLESAVSTAATLKDLGIPTDLGVETVITALDHHYTGPEWDLLEAVAGKFKQQGIPYQNLIKLMESGFTAGQSPANTLRHIDTQMQHMGAKGSGIPPGPHGSGAVGMGSGSSAPGGHRPGMGGMGGMGRQRHR